MQLHGRPVAFMVSNIGWALSSWEPQVRIRRDTLSRCVPGHYYDSAPSRSQIMSTARYVVLRNTEVGAHKVPQFQLTVHSHKRFAACLLQLKCSWNQNVTESAWKLPLICHKCLGGASTPPVQRIRAHKTRHVHMVNPTGHVTHTPTSCHP